MVTVSQNAADQIRKVRGDSGDGDEKCLRVAVADGGCSGHQYSMDFDVKGEGDTVFQSNGISVIVASSSLALLDGVEIDYVEDLQGSTFTFNNPNATGGCGCGKSFSA